jgi:hypothetical protein
MRGVDGDSVIGRSMPVVETSAEFLKPPVAVLAFPRHIFPYPSAVAESMSAPKAMRRFSVASRDPVEIVSPPQLSVLVPQDPAEGCPYRQASSLRSRPFRAARVKWGGQALGRSRQRVEREARRDADASGNSQSRHSHVGIVVRARLARGFAWRSFSARLGGLIRTPDPRSHRRTAPPRSRDGESLHG